MNAATVRDVSNMAAIGAEILAPWEDDGASGVTAMSLALFGDTVALAFRRQDGRGWTPATAVRSPERFGPLPADDRPTRANRATFLAWCERFAAGVDA